MRPLELKSKYGKPVRQLESAMIAVLSGYGDGQWFSLSQLVREMRLPSDFALEDDVERLVAQRLGAWNWYCHRAKWGDRFVRRNHTTQIKLIRLADRRNIGTKTSWPPHEAKAKTLKSAPRVPRNSVQKPKRLLPLQSAT